MKHLYVLIIMTLLIIPIGIYESIASQDMPVATITVFSEDGGVMKIYTLNGEATFDVAAGKSYRVKVSSYGYRSVWMTVPPLAPGETRSLSASLEPAPLIEGVVTDEDGSPIEGAAISIGGSQTFSGRDGFYAMYLDVDQGTRLQYMVSPPRNPEIFMDPPYSNLSGGTFEAMLFPYGSGYMNSYLFGILRLSSQVMNQDFSLPPATELSGRLIFRNNTPLNNAFVVLASKTSPITLVAPVVDGSYVFDGGVGEGSYNMYIRFIGYGGESDILADDSISISCSPSCPPFVSIGFFVPTTTTLELRIVDRDGVGVPGAYVTLEDQTGDISANAVTDENGDVKLAVYDAKTYSLSVWIGGYRVLQDTLYIPPNQNRFSAEVEVPLDLITISGSVDGWSGLEDASLVAYGYSELPLVEMEIPIDVSVTGRFSAKIPQFIEVEGFNVTLNYSLRISGGGIYHNAVVASLGMVSSSQQGITGSIPSVETATITIQVSFQGMPHQPSQRLSYRLGLYHLGRLYIIEVSNAPPSGCSGFCGAFKFVDGSLYRSGSAKRIELTLETVSHYQNKIYITIPKRVADIEMPAQLMDPPAETDMDRRHGGVATSPYHVDDDKVIVELTYNLPPVDRHTIILFPAALIPEFTGAALLLAIAVITVLFISRRVRRI